MDRPEASVVFHNATIVDGTGSPRFLGDVAVRGDRIEAIGPPHTLHGTVTIDASERVLAPGFIEIHSHADYTLAVDGRAHSYTLQGVTSVVTGNCGLGVAPISEASRDLVPMNIQGWGSDWEIAADWTSFGEYLDLLRKRKTAVNIFPLVAHGTLRLAVAGFTPRALTSREIDNMGSMVREAMESGAVGLSTGLEYAPGQTATTEELARASAAVGRHGGLYATHCRNRGEAMVEAAEEAVEIASRVGARLQLSHFVRRVWGSRDSEREVAKRAVETALGLRKRGLAVRFDVFPFEYGGAGFAWALPEWVREGGRDEVARRLADHQLWPRILGDMPARSLAHEGAADAMYVAHDGVDGQFVGRTLADIARSRAESVLETRLWLLMRAGKDFSTVHYSTRWAHWEDLLEALSDENFLIMGDGISGSIDGPLERCSFAPSDWGYAPVMLGRFVRELRLTSLESAIARMTSGPAAQLDLRDRGLIREGFLADLVLFDFQEVGAPIRPDQLVVRPTGVEYVMVNGEFVVTRSQPTDARPGLVGLKRH